MKQTRYYLFLLFIGVQLRGQTSTVKNKKSLFITPEVLIGKTMEANTDFPKTKLQTSFFVSMGMHSMGSDQQWAVELGYPKTGVSLGVTNFGNTKKIGFAYTIMPFVEVDLFKKYSERWNFNIAMGVSYLDTKYDADTNPFNRAITTDVNWSFRSFLYYDIVKRQKMDWRIGLGYTHFSNGHTRLPNQGLNSFLLSLSSQIGNNPQYINDENAKQNVTKKKSSEYYFSFRTGIGQNVLSRIFNDKKEVYSTALSMGKIINRTYKFGVGGYYRFYEHYYDHINDNKELISEQVPRFRKHPYRYATNFGVFVTSELLLGHVGIEFDFGFNIYKPFYKIDWQLSQGEFYNDKYTKLGELDWYYKVKRTISSRLGIKYYLFNTYKSPVNNFFLAAHINANLGQADFSELGLGYVYRFH
ncbi:acyloxyacyl hydrolase [Aquimarina sp. I32.4]|uniref:acyloxyacyl hydrolase n=1 Tax=Aquimarina sp. I32.4 TaxID=2053903 RepID=UPI000CDEF019|nr:acyloxyacyl hydrolase [Aquimarina sp. I32.4]